MDADIFGWLLTALAAPAFVHLYVEPIACLSPGITEPQPECWPLRLFEAAFFALTPTAGCSENARKKAWAELETAVASDPQRAEVRLRLSTDPVVRPVTRQVFDSRLTPAEFFAVALRCVVASWNSNVAEFRELASSSGVLDLLEQIESLNRPASREPQTGAPPAPGYVEVHVHKDGCVPYQWLWREWMLHDRLRPSVKILYPIEQVVDGAHLGMGSWKTSYAELLVVAADCETRLRKSLCPSSGDEVVSLREVIAHVQRVCSPLTEAVAYLSIYIGIRRSMVYDRGVSGLARFSDFFGTVGRLRRPKAHPERSFVRKQIAETMRRFVEDGAVAVELRPMLSGPAQKLRKTLDDLIAGYFDSLPDPDVDSSPLTRFGIVFSLRKNPNCNDRDDLAKPSLWASQSAEWSEQVKTLLEFLRDPANKLYRYFVVGIDAAGQEQGCPPRALHQPLALIHEYNKGQVQLPPGRYMSEAEIQAMRVVYQQSPDKLGAVADHLRGWNVDPIRLGITIHAGEDFADPMTGLRHIWETVETLRLRNGDRIGHALTAGLDPVAVRDLLDRRSSIREESTIAKLGDTRWRIHKPRGVHLIDLAWEWGLRGGGQPIPTSGESIPKLRRQLVESKLCSVASSAHGSPVNSERFLKALHNEEHPIQVLLPAVYFKDPAFLDPEDHEWVILDEDWLERFEELRLRVLQKLADNQIAVESCPTSNQRIGNLSKPPLPHLYAGLKELTLIATDDPGLFDSWPQHELAKFPTLRSELLENNRRHSFIRFRES